MELSRSKPCPCGGPLESWLFEALLFTLFFVVEEIEVLTEVVAVWEELDVLWCFYICFFWFTSKSSLYFGVLCKNNPKCSNCGQPHMASSKDCQHFIREKEIQKIKSEKNISYPEARRFVSAGLPVSRVGFSVFSIQVNIVWVSTELKTRLATLAYDFCVGESFAAETNLRAPGYAIFFSDFIFWFSFSLVKCCQSLD
jgi:hypothetical protein